MIRLLFAYLFLIFGCSPPAPTTVPVVTHHLDFRVPELKSNHQVFHASSAFGVHHRAVIREAADKWRRVSEGRIDIEVEFDLDPSNSEHTHTISYDLADDPEVQALDRRLQIGFPDSHTVALTTRYSDGRVTVALVVDRVQSRHFETVMTHELGHAIGLPDLPVRGAIMSAVHNRDDELSYDLAPADIELCRALRYCR